jgi:phytoene synthase
MTAEIVAQSRAVLSTHARSFRWASKFLPAAARDDAAVVYAFCRLVDDVADESPDPERALAELHRLEKEVAGEAPSRPLVSAFLEVASRRGIDVRSAMELIAGVRSDLDVVIVQTDAELLRYCYRVAGTVGLMMCPILGVTAGAAHPHAIDLGVAMQLTNICRDVLEDSGRGRVYLPADRLRAVGVEPSQILDGTADRAAVASVVRDILRLAESYYLSADHGMQFIPAKSRLAIVVASRLYRAIGIKLWRKRNGDALQGRTWITWAGKLSLVGVSLGHFVRPTILGLVGPSGHDRRLHRALRGLPGASGNP